MALDISRILEKKKQYEAVKDSIPEAIRISLENAFEVEYTHHSTAIEGNTLSDFAELIAVLEEKKLDKYLELAAIQEQKPPRSCNQHYKITRKECQM